MLERFAQKIAENTRAFIGYDVIVTNRDSIIVGASDFTRIGTFHEGSVMVIRTGRTNRLLPNYTVKMKGTKPGFTVPVEFNGEIIGSIGITGERAEVEKIGFLLKSYTELSLSQEAYLKSLVLSEQAVQRLIQEIIAFDREKHSEDAVINYGKKLGFDLTKKRMAVVFDFFNFEGVIVNKTKVEGIKQDDIALQTIKLNIKSVVENYFDASRDICVYIGNDKLVVLHALFNKQSEEEARVEVEDICRRVFDGAIKRKVKVSAGIGILSDSIAGLKKSYDEAWRILDISNQKELSYKCFFVGDYLLETFISTTEKDMGDWYITKCLEGLRGLSDYEELVLTIKTWCESGFRNTEAAKRLFVHRNTFNYRLEKMSKILNKDLKDFKNAIEVYIAIIALECRHTE
jgi:carbohydrate diacid regulator